MLPTAIDAGRPRPSAACCVAEVRRAELGETGETAIDVLARAGEGAAAVAIEASRRGVGAGPVRVESLASRCGARALPVDAIDARCAVGSLAGGVASSAMMAAGASGPDCAEASNLSPWRKTMRVSNATAVYRV